MTATNVEMRQVGHKLPELLLTQEHHMCPGCGEPLALRSYQAPRAPHHCGPVSRLVMK